MAGSEVAAAHGWTQPLRGGPDGPVDADDQFGYPSAHEPQAHRLLRGLQNTGGRAKDLLKAIRIFYGGVWGDFLELQVAGRVQSRCIGKRTLRAMFPHDRLDLSHALRSFQSFGG